MVLFDIDGTLMSSSDDEEKRRYESAARDLAGKAPSMVVSRFRGMVDPQICKILLAEIGLSKKKVECFLPVMLVRMGEVYRAMEKKPALNSGVEKLLRVLSKCPTHVLGVVTGNISAVATEKLAVVRIESYFSEGFYSDHYSDRKRLVEDAVEKCVTKYSLLDRKNMIVVGDTPLDVAAANAAGATSIGIASGVSSTRQLSDAGATRVFLNLEPSEELLKALGC